MKFEKNSKNNHPTEIEKLHEHLEYLDALINYNPDDLHHRMDEIVSDYQELAIRLAYIKQKAN